MKTKFLIVLVIIFLTIILFFYQKSYPSFSPRDLFRNKAELYAIKNVLIYQNFEKIDNDIKVIFKIDNTNNILEIYIKNYSELLNAYIKRDFKLIDEIINMNFSHKIREDK
ncbi:MAG: hypothetical protein WC337_06960 [Candidatus Muiribacteriota bacterium]